MSSCIREWMGEAARPDQRRTCKEESPSSTGTPGPPWTMADRWGGDVSLTLLPDALPFRGGRDVRHCGAESRKQDGSALLHARPFPGSRRSISSTVRSFVRGTRGVLQPGVLAPLRHPETGLPLAINVTRTGAICSKGPPTTASSSKVLLSYEPSPGHASSSSATRGRWKDARRFGLRERSADGGWPVREAQLPAPPLGAWHELSSLCGRGADDRHFQERTLLAL